MAGAPATEKPTPADWAAVGTPTVALRRRRLLDRVFRAVVDAGGFLIILSVLGILVFIVAEVYPLFLAPGSAPAAPVAVGAAPLLLGIEEYEEVAWSVTPRGTIDFARVDGSAQDSRPVAALQGRRATAASKPLLDPRVSIGTDDGRIVPVSIDFASTYDEHSGKRAISWSTTEESPVVLDPSGRPLALVALQHGPQGLLAAGCSADGRVLLAAVVEKKSMLGGVQRREERADLSDLVPSPPTALALDRTLENLYVGTRDGRIVHVDVRDPAAPVRRGIHPAGSGGAAITALGFLIGDQSLVVGDAAGTVRIWMQVDDPGQSEKRLAPVHDGFTPHAAPVRSIGASARDKGLVTADDRGVAMLRHGTTAQTLLTLAGEPRPAVSAILSPRATGLLVLHDSGTLSRWSLHNPHPEVTLRSLFGKVHYEGYNEPEYVWQSTGGTDDFEPKLSLTPLVFGTLKGTVYALLIAVPLAILGAMYTALFLHAKIRGIVKPVVEVMAALPSVVLGFIAGLWLAPTLERVLPALLLMAVVLPASAMLALGAWKLSPAGLRTWGKDRLELVFLLGALALSAWICLSLNRPVENWIFGGDFRQWWFGTTGLKFDQRNAIVVGFAMGFAVIPIIFTISEDALSNVPRHLVSGSLALGATPWQTAIRVVLPTASPGIFSAVMIGFGRVVGETMIVLMATGNTPILDVNPFNGFRTLSANIAVEIPEAPHGGTLYRTLFLGALLLFAATFLVNTAAEIVRQRMRQRYQQS